MHFGFKKQVETKSGKIFDISAGLSKVVELPDKPVKCEICQDSFAEDKYLATHVRFKHPEHLSTSKLSQSCSLSKTSYKCVNQATDQQVVDEGSLETTYDLTELEERESGIKINNRRGANQRKSYTIDFKIKTLDLLDTTKELWERVAERRGISKSLVVKWNKDRVKIRSQLALNKTKKNKGAARSTRQRRQLVCQKLKAKSFH